MLNDYHQHPQDVRLGFHKSLTPLGEVFHHVGSFTPMSQSPDMRPGAAGPWRSYGAWWQSLQGKQEAKDTIWHERRFATRYWPMGKHVGGGLFV